MASRALPHSLQVAAPALLAWVLLCPHVAAQSRRVQTVLTVHWSTEDFPSSPVMDNALRRVLRSRSGVPVDYYAEYLESDRFPEKQAATALRDYIRQKYRGRRIDLVIAVSDAALQFVLPHRQELFPNAPIVFTGTAAPPASTRLAGAGVTGVVSGGAYRETLQLALNIHPSTERVFVVAQAPTPTFRDDVRAQLDGAAPASVKISYVDEPSVPRLIAAIKSVPPRSLVLYIRYSQEDPGNVVFPDEVARRVADASPVPVYGIVGSFVGLGLVGGAIREREALGTRAAEIGLRILGGTRAQDIPIENAQLLPTFDWRQMQRWGIDPSRLPEAAAVRFRVPTTWERHRWQIVGAVSLMVFQAVLIGGLLVQHNRRRRAEEITRASEGALRMSYERIRQIAGHLINAQEAARTRIACDLHDDVCQELAGVSIAVSNLKRWRRSIQDLATQEALSDVQRRALGVVERVRRLSHDLHPGTLRHVGLAGALEAHCIEVEQQYDVQVTFRTDGNFRDISNESALCLFRISQEAMRNATTHGKARRMTVTASRLEHDVELTVTDDGIGFDLDAARGRRSGLGLVTMGERARLVGGQLHIDTQPGKGTGVRATVPLSAHARAAETAEEEADGYGGRHEYAQSPDRRRSQVVCRRYRSAPQRTVRSCRNGRRRQHARRNSAPSAPGRSSA
jgi:signal transduction histidine kinase